VSDSSADDATRKQQKREQDRRYREKNRDRIREYKRDHYRRNRERIREYNQQYYVENREEVLARAREYQAENGDLIRGRARNAYAANPEKVKAYHAGRSARGVYRFRHLWKAHGLDLAKWAALWEAQDGRCYLCRRELDARNTRKVHVEHWHGCGAHPSDSSCNACRRGLACSSCNLILGIVQDDPELLRAIAANLEVANRDVSARQEKAPQQLTLELG